MTTVRRGFTTPPSRSGFPYPSLEKRPLLLFRRERRADGGNAPAADVNAGGPRPAFREHLGRKDEVCRQADGLRKGGSTG
ncbi:hypothetical protein C725_1812 [Pacificimonas flava]|uniref:Uncharacterized protein n=1 Tax=Pacificimonas flava TaxID=1234595 RepID=M2U418_9SPHN|nr:hypothetical protein C725_1812 [Pacificimonas flava]